MDKRLNAVQSSLDSKKTLFIATKESSEKVELYVNYVCKLYMDIPRLPDYDLSPNQYSKYFKLKTTILSQIAYAYSHFHAPVDAIHCIKYCYQLKQVWNEWLAFDPDASVLKISSTYIKQGRAFKKLKEHLGNEEIKKAFKLIEDAILDLKVLEDGKSASVDSEDLKAEDMLKLSLASYKKSIEMKPDDNQAAVKEMKEIEDAHYHWLSTERHAVAREEYSQQSSDKATNSKDDSLSGFQRTNYSNLGEGLKNYMSSNNKVTMNENQISASERYEIQRLQGMKDEANDLYRQQKFEKAFEMYSKAIQKIEETHETILQGGEGFTKDLIAVYSQLLGNRSMVCIHLKKFSLALTDAEKTLVVDYKNIKAYYRIAMSLLGMCKDIESRLETVGNTEVKKELLLKQLAQVKRAK